MKSRLKYPFQKSRLAPSDRELLWLHKLCKEFGPQRILEIGCGITTWVIDNSCNPKTYVAVEITPNEKARKNPKFAGWYPNIENVKKLCPNVKIQENWKYGDLSFDFMFLDSSAGCKVRKRGVFRHVALQAAEPYLEDGAIVVIHDWNKRDGRGPRNRVTKSNKYSFMRSLNHKQGIAALRFSPQSTNHKS